MKQFLDSNCRSWSVAIDAVCIDRVWRLVGVNLREPACITRLSETPELLCNVLYAICEPQSTARGLNDVEFGRMLAGNPKIIERATSAMLYEIASLFPAGVQAKMKRAALK